MGTSRNRTAGHNFERDTVNRLKKSGLFPHASSSRLESRARDNMQVDIMNKEEHKHGRMPYDIQCKTYSTSLNYRKLLDEVRNDPGIMPVIFHKFTEKSAAGKFMPKGTYAILELDDFYQMMKYRKAYELLQASLTEAQKAELSQFGL